jgi:hypothetical protein
VSADFGNFYVVFSNQRVPSLTTTTVHAIGGGLSATGQIISRGNLFSQITLDGGLSGVIAVQLNLGLNRTVRGQNTRFGGILSNGPASGSVVILGQELGDVTIHGGLSGNYAVKGGILGNLLIDGGLSSTGKTVCDGQVGDPTQNTMFNVSGNNKGIIAAYGKMLLNVTGPTGYVFNNVGSSGNPKNATAINAIFTSNNLPLALDLSGLDLGGLASILLDMQNLKVVNGTLTGPVP